MTAVVFQQIPMISNIAIAVLLGISLYFVYKDIRMMTTMINDLREEFMILKLGEEFQGGDYPVATSTTVVEEDEESEDEEEEEEEPPVEEVAESQVEVVEAVA